ncbi:MAG: 23S rRNA (adenine(2503)-C(2))-methyltransferase RlmN [Myxococcales bacterium]|nr:23S rRNA (adenine(2503)-C(2))-methyltransferase RlmN [Myxococcales bacterium]
MSAFANLDLASMPLPVLRETFVGAGFKKFRADQLFRWLHVQMERDLDAMSDLPKRLRAAVSEALPFPKLTVVHAPVSAIDGSQKLVLACADGQVIESVVMPMAGGWTTQCLSSQVGCKMGCDFCATSRIRVRRDLTAGEIVEQVAIACRMRAAEGKVRGGVSGGVSGPLAARPQNLVFMGMGEPLDNFTALVDAISILTDAKGFGFSPRRITVSTVGLAKRVPGLIAVHPNLHLAWSLTATTDEVRDRLMPVNRGVPIRRMVEVLEALPPSHHRKITFEYALLKGVNDSDADAERLADMALAVDAHINAIPFNVWPGAPYERPSRNRVRAFADRVSRFGASISLRESKGQDIGAACGQLAGEQEGAADSAPAG